jgi:hypothetical protein
MGWMDWMQLTHTKHIRCPYCADGLDFRLMVRQGRSDWYICGACGHLAMPSSPFYQCICKNCCRLDEKRRTWNSAAPVGMIPRPGFFDDVHLRLRNLSRIFRRIAVSLY